jgi:hypothetical protein
MDRAASMLHEFLDANRAELIERCRVKVSRRPAPRPTPEEMEHGIPIFLDQLIEALRVQQSSATLHGHELLVKGFAVDQVIHDYGDLWQAVVELTGERNARISSEDSGSSADVSTMPSPTRSRSSRADAIS